MSDRYGAAPEQWRLYAELGLAADLLPVVSNPNARISPGSKMKALGKTPSRYNGNGQVSGFPDWTSYQATAADLERWAKQPDYGIAVQTRTLRAIDIDVDDKDAAEAITRAIDEITGVSMPIRWRANSGKKLLVFEYTPPMTKRMIPVAGGIIEFLGDGQQFIAEGTHPSGGRYTWNTTYDDDDILRDIPSLTEDELEALWTRLCTLFATGTPRIAHERRVPGTIDLDVEDDVASFLIDNWETYDVGQDGQIFIACPFADEHTSESGESSTAYFPAGTGGYADGNFVCLHAHCTGREQAEFLNATGFVASAFADISDDDRIAGLPEAGSSEPEMDAARADRQDLIAAERRPAMTRDAAHRIEPTMNNMLLALARPDLVGLHISSDAFKDVIVCADGARPLADAAWRPFRDTDYALVRQQLELRGFKPMSMDQMRLAVLAVAEANGFDTASEWLSRLVWDGVPRVEGFAERAWGWEPSPYAEAVGRYTWTALAGRVVVPGCQADMAPILVGPQGALKTSAIKAMVPSLDFYAEIKLSEQDANLSRLMRGTLVAELEELRGLNSKAEEEIKAFISRTHERWVPKYREFSTDFARRLIFFGTTNQEQFLADATGERRWLPGRCVNRLDVAWIAANREQLWAEGAARFRLDGIEWQDAERLARREHGQFKVADPWEPRIEAWMRNGSLDASGTAPIEASHLMGVDIAEGALHIPAGQFDRGKEMRIGKAMHALGWKRARLAIQDDGKRPWAYVREE